MHHIIELLIRPRTSIPSSPPKSQTGVGLLTEEQLHQAESWGIQSLELLQRPEVTTFLRDHQALAVPPNKASSSSSGSWFGTNNQNVSSEEEDEETELCGHALAAAYFNLGILREVSTTAGVFPLCRIGCLQINLNVIAPRRFPNRSEAIRSSFAPVDQDGCLAGI